MYFGGGTPSLFSARSLGLILESLARNFRLSPAAEITIEANPGTFADRFSRETMRSLRAVGFNRLSLGIQSFSARKLQFLERIHSAEDGLRSIEQAREAGFSNLSLDLIFGLPQETAAEWREDLREAARQRPDHVSTYALTIEGKSDFALREKRGERTTAKEEQTAVMYELAQEMLPQAGFKQYEISNFAKPGFVSVHNTGYWQYSAYLGLGAGAHSFCPGKEEQELLRKGDDSPKRPIKQIGQLPGRIGPLKKEKDIFQQSPNDKSGGLCFGRRWHNVLNPQQYQSQIRLGQDCREDIENLSREQAMIEFVFLHLRTAAGLSDRCYQQMFCSSLFDDYAPVIAELCKQALLNCEADTISLTKRGFLLSDSIFSAFASHPV